ncbi:MAG: DUF1501 domain-containing protein [Phycisphaeraceae bacterium]
MQLPDTPHPLASNRRHFFQQCGVGLGSIALASLLQRDVQAADAKPQAAHPMSPKSGHFKAKAKNIIFLFMAGGPSQLELFENKPKLKEFDGKVPPKEFMEGRRFAFLKNDVKLLGTRREFSRHGKSGVELSDLLPYHREIVDDVCFIRGLHTDVFNHGPAKIFMNTGAPQPGRPSMGSWVTYGIGSQSQNLPGFVVLQSGPRGPRAGASLWSSGFLPTTYQGVPFRGKGDPILNLTSPKGFDDAKQRDFFDVVGDLNRMRLDATADPEIATRIAAYEMAYRMQSSAPELMDIAKEKPETLEAYGAVPGQASFANNCLLARRLIERGVRFVQLYHTNWDHHGGPGETLEKDLVYTAKAVDQASAALVKDLRERGLLEDTLVIWGGEFGRTPMGEPRASTGRDHHIDAFTMWMAGAGVKKGFSFGKTDELGFDAVEGKVHVHDLHATILHLLGLEHTKLTFRFQGRDFRLTDVHGNVIREILT